MVAIAVAPSETLTLHLPGVVERPTFPDHFAFVDSCHDWAAALSRPTMNLAVASSHGAFPDEALVLFESASLLEELGFGRSLTGDQKTLTGVEELLDRSLGRAAIQTPRRSELVRHLKADILHMAEALLAVPGVQDMREIVLCFDANRSVSKPPRIDRGVTVFKYYTGEPAVFFNNHDVRSVTQHGDAEVQDDAIEYKLPLNRAACFTDVVSQERCPGLWVSGTAFAGLFAVP